MNEFKSTNGVDPAGSEGGCTARSLSASRPIKSSTHETTVESQNIGWAPRNAKRRPVQRNGRRSLCEETRRSLLLSGQQRRRNTSGHRAGTKDGRDSPSADRSRGARTCEADSDAKRERGPHGLIAAVDETILELADDSVYVLAAVLLADGSSAGRAFHDAVFRPGRVRNFHWSDEGRKTRRTARQLIGQHAAGRHLIAQHTSRTGQESARRALMAHLVPKLTADGVGSLIIESRSDLQDRRDRQVILDCIREHRDIKFNYEWRDKSEPLLWFADALAGAAREDLFGKPQSTRTQNQLSLTAADIEWLQPNPMHA